MTCDVLFSLACARIVASQARRVVSLRRRCVLEVCVFSLPCQWDLRSRGGRFKVSCLVSLALSGEPETCQNWSKSFWRHSPALVLDACRKRVKVGFCGRSSSLDDFEFVASLLCVTGAALSSVLVEFRGRRDTLDAVSLTHSLWFRLQFSKSFSIV